MNKNIAYIKLFSFNLDNKKCDRSYVLGAEYFELVDEEVLQEMQQNLKGYQSNIILESI